MAKDNSVGLPFRGSGPESASSGKGNTTNTHQTSAAKSGGWSPPSGKGNPPGKQIGGQHSPGKAARHGGGYGAGGNLVHPSLKKT